MITITCAESSKFNKIHVCPWPTKEYQLVFIYWLAYCSLGLSHFILFCQAGCPEQRPNLDVVGMVTVRFEGLADALIGGVFVRDYVGTTL